MKNNYKISLRRRSSGFALIEALVAAVIMAAGLVALALLQVRLTQITGDARDRSVATHLASEQVEKMRNFTNINGYLALNTSAAAESLGNVGGTEFTRSWTVTRYRYNQDPNADGSSADAAFQVVADNTVEMERSAEFKRVAVNVEWTTPSGQTKRVVVEDMISSATPGDGVNTAKPSTGPRIGPQVRIFKPNEEGVIPIAIGEDDAGNGVSAASSNPKPKQYADGSTGTTKFTVQTYTSDQANPLLQRQVDFAYASCSCKPGGTSTSTAPAYTISYWDGLRYTTPKELVGKKVGTRNTAVDQDVLLCDTCCRDHHDKTSESVKVDPWRPASLATVAQYDSAGDHFHFQPPNYNTAVTESSGVYAESCKMVRVDGIYRVATDTRLEDLSVLRLARASDGTTTLSKTVSDAYAAYAKKYTEDAVAARTSSYPAGGLPSQKATLSVPYELSATDTYGGKFMDQDRDNKIATTDNGVYNLAARGLYIDWLSPQALEKIACIGQTTREECAGYSSMSLLEFVPFVAINLTDLARWGSDNTTNVSVRNDPIPLDTKNGKPTSGTFVRGEVTALTTNPANVTARIARSNTGLVDTKALDAQDLTDVLSDQEEFGSSSTTPTIPDNGNYIIRIADNTSDQNFGDQNIRVELSNPTGDAPVCSRGSTQQTSTQHTCTYPTTALSIVMKWSNYNYKTCSALGNKWVYDAVNDRCVLPPQNKGGSPQYGSYTVRNFNLCSLTTPTGNLKITNRTEQNPGLATEFTLFTIDRNGPASVYDALIGVSNPTFVATFSTTACP